MRLRDRAWGALASLPAAALAAAAPGAPPPPRLAVVRAAFAAHDEAPRALADAVAPLAPGLAAVAADLALPRERLVVDEYALAPPATWDGTSSRPAGTEEQYRLVSVGGDLVRFLAAHGVRMRHVPDVRAAAAAAVAAAAAGAAAHARGPRQSTNEVLMVAPTAFGFNAQAAQDNTFMNAGAPSGGAAAPGGAVTRAVLAEFAGLHHELTEVAGVRVNLFQHALQHGTPDAVFPNNWFSTHAAGEGGGVGGSSGPAGGAGSGSTLVFYPMKCPNRAAERRADVVAALAALGFGRTLDLVAGEEAAGRYFEGTGVLVLDRVRGVAYVALSERADARLAERWAHEMGYKEVVTFHATDAAGAPVYHTNVMMAIGTGVAVACLESVADERERRRLRAALERHHEVVDISRAQMAALCGNVLELEDGRGLPVLALSTRAYNAFTGDQRRALRRHVAALHHAPIDTLEHVGGGGVRCTLAEIFR